MKSIDEFENEIRNLSKNRQGNEEVAVFFIPDEYSGSFRIDVVNPSLHVMLGEVEGEFSVTGDTLSEAMQRIKAKLNDEQI